MCQSGHREATEPVSPLDPVTEDLLIGQSAPNWDAATAATHAMQPDAVLEEVTEKAATGS
ncbi:MAG TPA: hypothetical protein VMQ46_04225 [Acidimicrobiia bacterium]|nr:hypothetical protein [Acidimicrobiia bacterium]